MITVNSIQPARIWAVSRYYQPNFSGMAIQAHRTFCRLLEQGCEVTVLTLAIHEATNFRKAERSIDGVKVVYFPSEENVPPRLTKFPGIQKMWGRMQRFLGELRVTGRMVAWLVRYGARDGIVQIYSVTEFCFLFVLVARLKGMHPVIVTSLFGADDGSAILKNYGWHTVWLRLCAFRGAKAIVGLSDALVASTQRVFGQKLIVRISPGIDVGEFSPAHPSKKPKILKELGLNVRQRYIVFTGLVGYRKGIDVLVEAFVKIAKQISNVDLLIVGPRDFSNSTRHSPGHQQFIEQQESVIAAAGLRTRVHWIGEVDNVVDYLRCGDVFCLPTRQEGFGISIIEAMAVGLPVVVSELPGVTTNIIHSSKEGCLIGSWVPEKYASAIGALLIDPARAKEMGRHARARVSNEFTLEREAGEYMQVYRRLRGDFCRG